MLDFADLFPIRHFFEAFFTAFDPATDRRRVRVGPPRDRRRLGGRRASLLAVRVLPLDAAQALDPASRPGRLPRVIHHVSVDVSDLERSGRFYDAVLGALGWRRHIDDDDVIGWGIVRPVFFASAERRPAPAAATSASPRAGSRRSRPPGRAASAPAGTDDGAPGPRPEYGGSYYSAYLRDPDGNRVEVAVGSD